MKKDKPKCRCQEIASWRRKWRSSDFVFYDSFVVSLLRWLVFPAVVQLLLCYRAAVVSDHSLGAHPLHTVIEWAHRLPMAMQTTRHPSGTTPPTSTLSTAACSPSACRTAEGKEVLVFSAYRSLKDPHCDSALSLSRLKRRKELKEAWLVSQ